MIFSNYRIVYGHIYTTMLQINHVIMVDLLFYPKKGGGVWGSGGFNKVMLKFI